MEITYTRNGDLTTIAKGKQVFTKSLSAEAFKEVLKLITSYNQLSGYFTEDTKNQLWDDIIKFVNPVKALPEGFKEVNGQIYYKDLTLPVAGLLQERMIQAINEDNQIWLESLVNFHKKCCNNKDTVNINKLYDHLAQNNKYTLTQDGYIKVYKKATINTNKDFERFKGYRLTFDKNSTIMSNIDVVNDFKQITEQDKLDFLDFCNVSTIYASHINQDKFYLVDPVTLERTEKFGRCEYKLNYITMLDKDRCERGARECAFKLHSTCQADYADKFSGNIVLTCLLDPEWVVFVPDADLSWKLGSYALWTVGVDDIEKSEKQANLYIKDSYTIDDNEYDEEQEEYDDTEENENELVERYVEDIYHHVCPECGSVNEFHYTDICHNCGFDSYDFNLNDTI